MHPSLIATPRPLAVVGATVAAAANRPTATTVRIKRISITPVEGRRRTIVLCDSPDGDPRSSGPESGPITAWQPGNQALRGERWLSTSDSAGGDGSPGDAAAEEESASIVGEVAVAVADATDLLDQQVDRFGRSVAGAAGGVEGEDLVAPAVDGAGEAGEFGDLDVGGVLEEHDQPTLGVGQVVGGVDLRQELAGEPHGGDFAVGVAGGEPGAEA